jgi:hypothetical protein
MKRWLKTLRALRMILWGLRGMRSHGVRASCRLLLDLGLGRLAFWVISARTYRIRQHVINLVRLRLRLVTELGNLHSLGQ